MNATQCVVFMYTCLICLVVPVSLPYVSQHQCNGVKLFADCAMESRTPLKLTAPLYEWDPDSAFESVHFDPLHRRVIHQQPGGFFSSDVAGVSAASPSDGLFVKFEQPGLRLVRFSPDGGRFAFLCEKKRMGIADMKNITSEPLGPGDGHCFQTLRAWEVVRGLSSFCRCVCVGVVSRKLGEWVFEERFSLSVLPWECHCENVRRPVDGIPP